MSNYTKKEIVKDIKDKIKNGELKYDERLATERELMDQYNVSRTTIRNAIAELELRRLVYRIPDTGIFVQKEIIRKTNSIIGFTKMIEDSGRIPTTKVIQLKKVVPEEKILEVMGLEENTEVYFFERLRYVDDKPFLYELTYVNPTKVPNIEQYDFTNKSFYKTVKEHYDIRPHYLQENVSAVTVDGKISDFLYQTSTAYCLKVEGTSHEINDDVIEYGISYFHAEDFSFESVLVNMK